MTGPNTATIGQSGKTAVGQSKEPDSSQPKESALDEAKEHPTTQVNEVATTQAKDPAASEGKKITTSEGKKPIASQAKRDRKRNLMPSRKNDNDPNPPINTVPTSSAPVGFGNLGYPTAYPLPANYTNSTNMPSSSIAQGYNTPGYGPPGLGAHNYGTPNWGVPNYGAPGPGTPGPGVHVYGAPGYGAHGYGTPSYGALNYGTPSFGATGYDAAGLVAPGYGAPTHGTPNYLTPNHVNMSNIRPTTFFNEGPFNSRVYATSRQLMSDQLANRFETAVNKRLGRYRSLPTAKIAIKLAGSWESDDDKDKWLAGMAVVLMSDTAAGEQFALLISKTLHLMGIRNPGDPIPPAREWKFAEFKRNRPQTLQATTDGGLQVAMQEQGSAETQQIKRPLDTSSENEPSKRMRTEQTGNKSLEPHATSLSVESANTPTQEPPATTSTIESNHGPTQEPPNSTSMAELSSAESSELSDVPSTDG